MKTLNAIILATMLLGAFDTIAAAQDRFVVYDRERGELSPGTQAPTRARMVDAIRRAPASELIAVLEYGERVECHECVPLLQRNLLAANDARVRQISAWWLRHRLFGYGATLSVLRRTLAEDADAVRRERAAEALGEFMDPTSVVSLRTQLARESTPAVRGAIVRAAARINVPSGHDVLVAGLADASDEVRSAALQVALRVNFFDQYGAILPLLADPVADVRRRAALLVGSFGVAEAVPGLAGLLRSDEDVNVRQAAAWALGRIGGADARTALGEAATAETEPLVRDAIDIAQRMVR